MKHKKEIDEFVESMYNKWCTTPETWTNNEVQKLLSIIEDQRVHIIELERRLDLARRNTIDCW